MKRREAMSILGTFPFIGKSLFDSMLETPPDGAPTAADLVAGVEIHNAEIGGKLRFSAYGIALTMEKIGEPDIGYSILNNANDVITTSINATLEIEVRNKKVFSRILDAVKPWKPVKVLMTPRRPGDKWTRMVFPAARITHGKMIPIQGHKDQFRYIIEGRLFPDDHDRFCYLNGHENAVIYGEGVLI